MPLPDFIAPMLAKAGEIPQSANYLFELKWGGLRAQARIDATQWSLTNAEGQEITQRYPEFTELDELPAGTILDGEIVVLNESAGPDFHRLLKRESARAAKDLDTLVRTHMAHFVVYDVLYHEGNSLLQTRWSERRDVLLALLAGRQWKNLLLTRMLPTADQNLWKSIEVQSLPGLIAKRIDAVYEPGEESGAWLELSRKQSMNCFIMGWTETADGSLESLLVGADLNGDLAHIGTLPGGWDGRMKEQLEELLPKYRHNAPVVPCEVNANWTNPGLFCAVSYAERDDDGWLVAPKFEDLIIR